MTHDERVQRLKRMLRQVAGPGGLEAVSMPTRLTQVGGFEDLGVGAEAIRPKAESADTVRDKAESALFKLKENTPINPGEAFGLEAIVLPDKRPVVFIRNDAFDALVMDEWVHLNKPEVHARLEPSFTSIGRIELPTNPSIPYGGTGFVVGPNLLMTNRHVARLFAEGLGMHLMYHAGGSAVSFKREVGMPESDNSARLQVEDVRMIHPYWDMALLKVTGLPASANPLKLSVQPSEAFVGKDVVVVGYPARDYRNDLAVQDRVFAATYGVKRMQPGKAQPRERVESFENLVDAMTHDSSTLGGNSGSAVIDVATGTVIGLHFAGEYLKANYAVPTYELARDQHVVDAGLNFQGSVAPTTDWASSWDDLETYRPLKKEGRDRGGKDAGAPLPADPPATDGDAPPRGAPRRQTTDGTKASLIIPLYLTVSVGTPIGTGAAMRIDLRGTTDAEALVEKVPVIYPNIEQRGGYQENFLELAGNKSVPMPQLTPKGKAVAAKLDDGSAVLKYHRFSVVMHKKRRLALFTAANVDWRPQKRTHGGQKPGRKELDGFTGNEREDWVIDPRIPLDHQLPDYFYRKGGGAFDRGHLVRRDDVAWGDSFKDMQKGNGDTFHMTNCSPQTAGFNRPAEYNWGALEQMVQMHTNTERVCIFSGPVLDDKDEYFHGLIKSGVEVSVQIPRRFWKIIVAKQGGKPAAFGFVLEQDLADVDLYAEMAVPNAWKNYMRPISAIEGYLNGLAKLSWFVSFDQF